MRQIFTNLPYCFFKTALLFPTQPPAEADNGLIKKKAALTVSLFWWAFSPPKQKPPPCTSSVLIWGARGYFNLTYGVITMNTEINKYDELCKQQDKAREKVYKRFRFELAFYQNIAKRELAEGKTKGVALDDALGNLNGITITLRILRYDWDSELSGLYRESTEILFEIKEQLTKNLVKEHEQRKREIEECETKYREK